MFLNSLLNDQVICEGMIARASHWHYNVEQGQGDSLSLIRFML